MAFGVFTTVNRCVRYYCTTLFKYWKTVCAHFVAFRAVIASLWWHLNTLLRHYCAVLLLVSVGVLMIICLSMLWWVWWLKVCILLNSYSTPTIESPPYQRNTWHICTIRMLKVTMHLNINMNNSSVNLTYLWTCRHCAYVYHTPGQSLCIKCDAIFTCTCICKLVGMLHLHLLPTKSRICTPICVVVVSSIVHVY